MRKKLITVQFEFFKNQDTESLEILFRDLTRKRRFPKFQKMLIMVHHRNLKQRNLKEEFPMMVEPEDAKKLEQ